MGGAAAAVSWRFSMVKEVEAPYVRITTVMLLTVVLMKRGDSLICAATRSAVNPEPEPDSVLVNSRKYISAEEANL